MDRPCITVISTCARHLRAYRDPRLSQAERHSTWFIESVKLFVKRHALGHFILRDTMAYVIEFAGVVTKLFAFAVCCGFECNT